MKTSLRDIRCLLMLREPPVKALGLMLLAPESPADSATGAFVPEGVDGAKLVKFLRDTMGVTLAGGQDHLKGKIIRIAHLGYYDTFDIIIAIFCH